MTRAFYPGLISAHALPATDAMRPAVGFAVSTRPQAARRAGASTTAPAVIRRRGRISGLES